MRRIEALGLAVNGLVLSSMLALCHASESSTAASAPATQEQGALDEMSMPPEPRLVHPEIPRIAPKEVRRLLEERADIVIVDTQDPDGYDMWHIPTAVNIPFSPTENPADRAVRLSALSMEKLIVVYCLCEEGADSASVALELRKLGFGYGKVKVLGGGMIKWDDLGYPLIKK